MAYGVKRNFFKVFKWIKSRKSGKNIIKSLNT